MASSPLHPLIWQISVNKNIYKVSGIQSRIRIQVVVKTGNVQINERYTIWSQNNKHSTDLQYSGYFSLSGTIIQQAIRILANTMAGSQRGSKAAGQCLGRSLYLESVHWGTNHHLQLVNRSHTHLEHKHVYTHQSREINYIQRQFINLESLKVITLLTTTDFE